MTQQFDVSVVICTYNRCHLLPAALESLLDQQADGLSYEVVVVDNNSRDETRQVIESFIARGHNNMRYVFEGKQGLSHARNAGIANSRAPIVAFTDDDVRVECSWVATNKRALDEHPEVDFVGGKTLPRWEKEPPAWLTRRHWSPLALLDYGDQPFYADTENPICLIGASLCVRRHVFDKVGLFSPEFQHFKGSVCSTDDHEFLTRIWDAGGKGLYLPDLFIIADVQAERMTKAYHRKWHWGHGYLLAKMRLTEIERSGSGRLFDVPAHLYRQAAVDALGWLKHALRGDAERAFAHETELRFFAGYFQKRREDFAATKERGTLGEIGAFVRSFANAKKQS
ncbi:MAG: glycosyltransferase family 2 protein [Acidobacteriota bacterium]|nr:glycosyltransferase family 2 protein [Acidobacteriota bacterium]